MSRQTLQSIALLIAVVATPAYAYVGPGAGLTMLGSLWGLIIAVVFIVFGLLILPIKLMRNRMKKNKAEQEAQREAEDGSGDEARDDS